MLSVEEFILQLCRRTKLSDCTQVAKDLERTVSNARNFNAYSLKVLGLRNNSNVENNLRNHVAMSSTILDDLAEEMYLQEINEQLDDVETRQDFESLIEDIKFAAGLGLTWWQRAKKIFENIWGVITNIANYLWEKVRSCLTNPKCVFLIALVLWMIYCHFYGEVTKEKEVLGADALDGGTEWITVTEYNDGCVRTDELFAWIKLAFERVYTLLKNAFLSIFGMNEDYILPGKYNYVSSAEEWDYALFKVGTNVGFGGVCAGTSMFYSLGAGLSSTGVGFGAGAAVFGTGMVLGSLCYGASSIVNETIMKGITKEQYLMYERVMMRPIIILLEKRIYNFTISFLSKDSKTRQTLNSLNDWFLLLADLANGLRTFYANLLVGIKSVYGRAATSSALTVFNMAVRNLDDAKELMKSRWQREKKLTEIKQQDVEARLVLEAEKYFRDIKFNPNSTKYLN